MSINAINPNLNSSKRRADVDAFINLDDNSLRKIAYMQAVDPKADKRSRRKSNLLMNSIPVAAGVLAAAKTPKLITKTGRLGKIAQFAETTTKWFLAFGIIDLVAAGRNKIHQKSEKAREFAQKHPILSLATTVGASMLAIGGAYKGFGKVADKVLPKITDKYGDKITKAVVNLGNKLDNSKVLNKMSELTSKVSNKTPEFVKSIGQGLLEWSPLILGISAISNTSKHAHNKANAINEKYIELKDKQIVLAQAKNRELEIQRDFLLTNPKNADDMSEVF